jgi:hypothetical protein
MNSGRRQLSEEAKKALDSVTRIHHLYSNENELAAGAKPLDQLIAQPPGYKLYHWTDWQDEYGSGCVHLSRRRKRR